ncbi:MAG: cupin domain-containing protein, partial [Opitutus sp.]
SLVERGESSPTAVVLEKLATGLGVTLASLFDPPVASKPASSGPLARRADQPQWRDPASGYVRRNVSPMSMPHPFRIVDVLFPAGARVAFESGSREDHIFQQVWMLNGAMTITHGATHHRLEQGDCLALQLDRPMMFHNPTRKAARYVVVISTDVSFRR